MTSSRWIAACLFSSLLVGCDRKESIEVTARFSASPLAGSAPLEVQFTDLSRGDIGSWEWDFGDGTILPRSVPSSPSHTYEEPGTYTVTLHVISCTSAVNCKHDWDEKVGLITVAAPARVETPGGRSGRSRSVVEGSEIGRTGIEDPPGPAAPGRAPGVGLLELIVRCARDEAPGTCRLDGLQASLVQGSSETALVRVRSARGDAVCARYLLPMHAAFPWGEPAAHLSFRLGRDELELLAPGRGDAVRPLAAFQLAASLAGVTRVVLEGSLALPPEGDGVSRWARLSPGGLPRRRR